MCEEKGIFIFDQISQTENRNVRKNVKGSDNNSIFLYQGFSWTYKEKSISGLY